MKINKLSFLMSLSLGIFILNLTAISAIAQETEVETETQVETTVENTETPKAPKRLRATFFEEERRLKFGEGLFLQSALDGAQNAFPDPAKIGNFNSDLIRNGQEIPGTVVIQSRRSKDFNYLWTDFTPLDPGDPSFQFREIIPSSSTETRGRVTVIGDPSFVGNYNAGYSSEGDKFSTTILVTDPNNPSQSILIEVSPVNLDGFSDLKDRDPTPAARARLTTGLPTDR
jgi:hypothetical protein